MTVALIVLCVVAFLAAMVLFTRRAVREIQADRQRPAPLESGSPREAVRSAMDRRA